METIRNGIVRNVDEGIASDGQCMELINARIKNGAVDPISMHVFLCDLPPSRCALSLA